MQRITLRRTVLTTLSALAILAFTGCASIVDGGARKIAVVSDPDDAKVTVYNKKGTEVACQQTPATLKLKRSSGYFSGAQYRLLFEKPGYEPTEINLKSTINGWYFGNFFFGGMIGLLAVDPATGAMWTLQPRDVTAVLHRQQATTFHMDDHDLFVMLRQDIDEEVSDLLIPLPRE